MKKFIPFLAAAMAVSNLKAAGTITIDAGKPVGAVSPLFAGLMTEEINHSYDGGLYAELIQNRAFLDNATTPVHWSPINVAAIAIDPANPLNDELTNSLRVMVTQADGKNPAGVANDGYWGIPVQPKATYRATIFAKADGGFTGPVTISIVGDDNHKIYAAEKLFGLTANWNKFEVTLKTGRVQSTAKAHVAITLAQPGTIWLGMVSLFPPTWNDQPNGFRKDLMRMMVDLHPKFLRMPGGNYIEGNTIDEWYDWKKTIGPVEQRHGHPSPWGYRSTDGLGLLEFLKWCEDMQAEPVLAVYAGYSLRGMHVNPGTDLQPYVQSALDEIEYVAGDTNTTWGARRAQDGHPAPFALHYVEIGNEDWFDKSKSYDARFVQFYDAIKARYPQIKTISTIGNDQPDNLHVQSRKPDMTDEHYYRSVDTFRHMSPGYATNYDRSGPEIFVGEWAAYETAFPPWDKRSQKEPPTPDLKAAIGDAMFMCAMERNSDLIKMQCYAPMLVNVNPGGRQWRPNLIGYDAVSAYGSPSYYAIKMFNENTGDQILSAASTETSVQSSATRDNRTGEVFVKLVNPETNSVSVKIDINGVTSFASKGEAVTLAGNPDDTNSLMEPAKVMPVTKTIRGIKPDFVYPVPPNSIVILKFKP